MKTQVPDAPNSWPSQSASLSRGQFSKYWTYPLATGSGKRKRKPLRAVSVQTINCHGLQWAAKTSHGQLASYQPQ